MDILERILGELNRTERLFEVDYRAGRTALKETTRIVARLIEIHNEVVQEGEAEDVVE